jgi:hypothetical protein
MKNPDRLYDLLPVVYRQRDADQGHQLQALLRVIAEQVDVVEDDIARLNDNWFIETCDDWVVPYLGDLIGYRPVHEAGEPGDPRQPAARELNKILIPRRDVANTIRDRRRKGTLALLELLANDAAGWPARAVEFYRLLAWFQHLDHQHRDKRGEHDRGRTADLRCMTALDRLGGPFDEIARTVDVRRVNSARTPGRHNLPSVGVFVWRLRAYPVTRTPAQCLDENPHCYTFSVLGNDAPLFTRSEREIEPTHIAGELNVPAPIRRLALERRLSEYYGEGKSFALWLSSPGQHTTAQLVPASDIRVADLSGWHYRPEKGKIAVDPVHGRIAFPPGHSAKKHVSVSCHYGFSADIGGGEYQRTLTTPKDVTPIQVSGADELKKALRPWQENESPQEQPENVVIEIRDSGLYVLPINLALQAKRTLQIRAANGARPVLRLLDWSPGLDSLSVSGGKGSRLTLDGLLITGRGISVSGPDPEPNDGQRQKREDDLCEVVLRHCTLVPGWSLDCGCEPCRAEEPSLELVNTTARVKIEHCILGTIRVEADATASEPLRLDISDSLWDATSDELPALSGPDDSMAYARLTVARCTVFGEICAHELALAENSIFAGEVCVARRQTGCVRFCYVPPESRTPRRYECQPDLVLRAVREAFSAGEITTTERDAALAAEALRVIPEFNGTRYGQPAYGQLADTGAEEIRRGADDESELGAFHDLFQPQREANLRARLDEYTPAGMDAGIIYVT